MNYAIMIAAVFILATIAVAVLSPFDHLPQRSPQEAAAAAQSDDGSSSDDSSYGGNSSYGNNSSSNIRGQGAEGEAPPP